jgi:hypothetical protein
MRSLVVVPCSVSLLALSFATSAVASTVECKSRNYEYTECRANFRAPQLVVQESRSPCIVNRTWGFNPQTRYLWVAEGCAGIFDDQRGYHYGRSDRYDTGAPRYDDRGRYIGPHGTGELVDRPWHDRAQDVDPTPQFDRNGNPNFDEHGRYIGGHGVGQLVDDPDSQEQDRSQDVDPTVQKFDRQGNPNYDADGRYIGGHGLGTKVDPPSDDDDGGG